MKSHRRFTLLLSIVVLFLAACGNTVPDPPTAVPSTATGDDGLTPIDLSVGYGVRGSWFELYFTDPVDPLSLQGTGGVDVPLVQAIDDARLSIDIAAYSLSLNSVRNALINAHQRGVTVRMVMETSNMDNSDPQRIIDAGIPVVGDNRDGLMHDKFVVIDRSEIWLGSMNFTDSGAYDDNNNMLRIHSTKMAENYIKEFEEMFLDNLFGDNVRAETPNPTLSIDGTQVDTLFSPDDGVANHLAALLSSAEESIHFLAFSFTSNDLGGIIRAKAEEGLEIHGVMDEEQIDSNQGTEFDPFRQADLDVLIDGIPGQMHHKLFIIDGKIVVLGSYNFSQSAETRNDENTVVIYNAEIAEQYLKEFERVAENSYE